MDRMVKQTAEESRSRTAFPQQKRAATTLSARRRIAAVFAGGFCGTLMRYGLSTLVQALLGKGWPYDILLINISGACVLAFVTTLADATILVGPTRRLFINVGLLGAYTTFSSLALGDVLLFAKGQWLPALLYLALSIAGGVQAVLLGDWLGQRFVARIALASSRAKTQPGRGEERSFEVTTHSEHVDIQDDVLLPDAETERHEPRQHR